MPLKHNAFGRRKKGRIFATETQKKKKQHEEILFRSAGAGCLQRK